MTRRDISLCDHTEHRGRNLGGSILDSLIVSIVLDKGEVLDCNRGPLPPRRELLSPVATGLGPVVLTRLGPVVSSSP